jgi:hypothetical protein
LVERQIATDLDNLLEPEVLAEEIIQNMEAGLNNFREVLASLKCQSNESRHNQTETHLSTCYLTGAIFCFRID